jgi:hypothetical protein
MQAAKDSFYVTLRDRLVVIDPQRTITLDGAMRPAIAVDENEPADGGPPLCDTFYLHWGSAHPVQPSVSTLMAAECTISYYTEGTEANAGLDRGRELASLDNDVLAISSPCCIAKCDYSSGSPVPLGSTLFWTPPVLNAAKVVSPYVGREAAVTVFFYPEVNQR